VPTIHSAARLPLDRIEVGPGYRQAQRPHSVLDLEQVHHLLLTSLSRALAGCATSTPATTPDRAARDDRLWISSPAVGRWHDPGRQLPRGLPRPTRRSALSRSDGVSSSPRRTRSSAQRLPTCCAHRAARWDHPRHDQAVAVLACSKPAMTTVVPLRREPRRGSARRRRPPTPQSITGAEP
jgi:hypothetical protein